MHDESSRPRPRIFFLPAFTALAMGLGFAPPDQRPVAIEAHAAHGASGVESLHFGSARCWIEDLTGDGGLFGASLLRGDAEELQELIDELNGLWKELVHEQHDELASLARRRIARGLEVPLLEGASPNLISDARVIGTHVHRIGGLTHAVEIERGESAELDAWTDLLGQLHDAGEAEILAWFEGGESR